MNQSHSVGQHKRGAAHKNEWKYKKAQRNCLAAVFGWSAWRLLQIPNGQRTSSQIQLLGIQFNKLLFCHLFAIVIAGETLSSFACFVLVCSRSRRCSRVNLAIWLSSGFASLVPALSTPFAARCISSSFATLRSKYAANECARARKCVCLRSRCPAIAICKLDEIA